MSNILARRRCAVLGKCPKLGYCPNCMSRSPQRSSGYYDQTSAGDCRPLDLELIYSSLTIESNVSWHCRRDK